jgi:transposase
MKKIREVLRMSLDRKASVRQIASACNIGRTTVNEYLARAKAADLNWPLPEETTDADLTRLLFPVAPQTPAARSLPDWCEVRRELSHKGMTLLLVWQTYKDQWPDGYSYSRFARLYRQWLKASDLSMVQRHKAGERLQVDWAGPQIRIVDPKTGEVRGAPVFVSALGVSQMIFARAYESQDQESWLRAHVDAFEFYGALPEIVVCDNPKTAVTSACRYEPTLNPAYAELAGYYNVAVVPARVRRPKDKAKVENAVQQVERWVMAPLKDRTFFSVAEANEAIEAQLEKLSMRMMKGPNLSRKQLFEAEDKPAMRLLPAGRYSYAAWKRVKVAPDYHVEVEGCFYSVPFTLVAQHVDVRISPGIVEVCSGGKRVASHLRPVGRRRFVTDASHMPEKHRAHAQWAPERIERWAGVVGPNAAAFVAAVLAGKQHPEQGYRTCMGVISLEKRFGKDRLEAACGRATSLGALSYQSVKSILEKNLEQAPATQTLPPLPSHDNVRGGSYYKKEEPCAR